MAAKKGKKRLSRRARQQHRDEQERRQAYTSHSKKLVKRQAVETRRRDNEKLRRKACVDDTITVPFFHIKGISPEKTHRFQSLAQEVWGKRPGLLDHPYRSGLFLLALVAHGGPAADWTPAGRGLTAAFRSLAVKLLGGYHANVNLIDSMLVDHFGHDEAKTTACIAKAVISGAKVSRLVGTTVLPAPLTRRMCHIMVNPDRPQTVVQSARRAQVLAYGGNEALARAVGSGLLGSFKTIRQERFWDEVIHWFCRQPDLKPDQVDPICDYLQHCHGENRRFSLKGRTVASLNRGMKHWHQEVNDLKRFAKKEDFQPSGFANSLWKKTRLRDGEKIPYETWAMREIRSPKDLVNEGSTMCHCVGSYYLVVRKGQSSIWSLTRNKKRLLTVEVRNKNKTVVQVRGKHNRLPKEKEQTYIQAWAKKNCLNVSAKGM